VAREFAHPLSAEQSSVMRRALSGESLFITGAAGTGKSFLLRQIVAAVRAVAPLLDPPPPVSLPLIRQLAEFSICVG
jgi:Cdc6-like AAA superfamily ATPase